MDVVIIDYGAGNLRSAEKAFERAAREGDSGAHIAVSAAPNAVRKADYVVLPGVGAFGDCMAGVCAIEGMRAALEEAVIEKARPFLGICVGMQLMATTGFEHGAHEGFGWLPGAVRRIAPADPTLKIPHMGWNEARFEAHPVFEALPSDHAYFVHSYHMTPEDPAHILASADYGGPITAAVGRDNMVGTQFHPEKSQALGLALIANFLNWKP